MNLRDLEIFFAVADELHFGRAAMVLRIKQSSVSESIVRLETALGAPLFYRTTRRVSITDFGGRVLANLRPAYAALHQEYAKAVADGHHRGELRLGHTPELGQALLPGLVRLTAHAGPGAPPSWRPLAMHTHEQIAALQSGAIDVGLCWEPSVNDQITQVVLATAPLVAILRDDDSLAEPRSPISLRELAGRPLIVSPRTDNQMAFARIERAFIGAGIDMGSVSEVSHYDAVSLHVARGYGIGVHPAPAVGLNRVPGLAFRRVADEGVGISVCAIVLTATATREVSQMLGALRAVTTEVINAI
ncbi:LysR family transcriptional regulator [Microbacterium kyungheense]|uniref:DNA-binding transcriptional LysR family regulator n=1 Tax=Microbacterium kyungheense TaxID=1263636 RepID=A0A543EUF4_9MICO|nr:LysR family transcriptional regulator [Microbacterium kyungheense]TQM25199.1 DNA-binding transcriptional LysR family regulator [Microbacterium kyungheense]